MDVKELRIGNWVNHIDNWSYRQPKQDYKEFNFQWEEDDWFALSKCTLNIEDIEPIPLTEEWLLKFGFIKCRYDNSYEYKNFSIFLDKRLKENVYLKSKNDWNVFNGLKLQYVHQLQNLYFALTGEELILKNEL